MRTDQQTQASCIYPELAGTDSHHPTVFSRDSKAGESFTLELQVCPDQMPLGAMGAMGQLALSSTCGIGYACTSCPKLEVLTKTWTTVSD